MKPTQFPGTNVIFGKGQEQYQPLPAIRTPDGTVITCWELTDEEVESIVKNKKLYIQQLTFNQQLQPILPLAELGDNMYHGKNNKFEFNFPADFKPNPVNPDLEEQYVAWFYLAVDPAGKETKDYSCCVLLRRRTDGVVEVIHNSTMQTDEPKDWMKFMIDQYKKVYGNNIKILKEE